MSGPTTGRDGLATLIARHADGGVVAEDVQRRLAESSGCPRSEMQRLVCEAGCLPERYRRNGLTPSQQLVLLNAHAVVFGLGGLGGFVAEELLRLGIGRLTAVDGDAFEPSNLNRQLLATRGSLTLPKTAAFLLRAEEVNPAVAVHVVPSFADAEAFRLLAARADVCFDALGGARTKAALLRAVRGLGVPVITGGIAGMTGWCAAELRRGFAEERLARLTDAAVGRERDAGNLACTASVTAGMQVSLGIQWLLGTNREERFVCYDLRSMSFAKT